MTQASIPSPRTWASGDLVTVPRLRADVVNAVAFLRQRPYFYGQNTTGASWAGGSDNTLGLDSELTDIWAGHVTQSANGALSSQYWAPVPGWYLCRSIVTMASQGSNAVVAGGFQGITSGVAFGPLRGALTMVNSSSQAAAQCCDLVQLAVGGPPGGSGDYVQATAFSSTGGNLSTTTGLLPAVSVRWAAALSGTQPLPVPPLTAVPSPITHAWLNADVRDTIGYLTYPPLVKAFNASGSVAASSYPSGSVVPLASTAVDTYGGFSVLAHTYTVPVAGRYLVYGQHSLQPSSSSVGLACGVTVNGGSPQWGDSVYFAPGASLSGGASFSRYMRFSASDVVRLVSGTTGGAIAYNGSAINETRMILMWTGI